MGWFWEAYLPDAAVRQQPTAPPLNASLDQLAGLPEALIIVDENDVLRDEGEAYARKPSPATRLLLEPSAVSRARSEI
jgi:acetyl esterase